MKDYEKDLSMNKKSNSTYRSWQRMLSGRRLNLIEPSPLDIEIEDIARGIARVARWNGQTIGKHPISVAQHCVIVTAILNTSNELLEKKWLLASLLHDAAEYIVGDMITPLKSIVGDSYANIESKLQSAIHIRFSLPPILPKNIKQLIKKADKQTAYLEATQLAGFSEREAREIIQKPKDIPEYKIITLSAYKAEKLFLNTFKKLSL